MAEDSAPEEYGPEFEVWNHLWSSIDMADMEYRVLGDDRRRQVIRIGERITDARAMLARAPGTEEAAFLELEVDLLADPWVRFSAELHLAKDAIGRGQTALRRYFAISPVVTERPLPPRAAPYVVEVVNTFAFGFDAACIALCRATFEQLMKEELVTRGILTEPQLRRSLFTADTLLQHALRADVIVHSRRAAEALVFKGNTVMHKSLYQDKISEQQAADSIAQLLDVLREVLGEASATE
jgi:hypothetical protein